MRALQRLKENWPSIWSVLFCILFYLNFGSVGDIKEQFQELLISNNPEISYFRLMVPEYISALISALVLFATITILVYCFKKIKILYVFIFGILLKWWVSIFLLSLALFLRPSEAYLFLQLPFAVYILFLIELAAVLFAIYKGIEIGQSINCLDDKDETKNTLYGLPKIFWLLLMVSFNPIYILLIQASFVVLYASIDIFLKALHWAKILTWDGFWELGDIIFGPVGAFFSLALIWFLTFGLYNFGIRAIKDKTQPYRAIIIIAIFVALPLFVVIVPLIRNRTWLFFY